MADRDYFIQPLSAVMRGVFRNNVDFFNNFAMLCIVVIKVISMCFRIFLPSFRRVWLSSDDFAKSYRPSKRVTDMNPGHVKSYNTSMKSLYFA